jgi:hypothetical protein
MIRLVIAGSAQVKYELDGFRMPPWRSYS